MSLKIGDRIAFLRKKKGITQEELAGKLKVTNQSVSKWESGQCCPDIQLLPELASFFEVSIDELLGYRPADNFADAYLKLKSIMEEAGKDSCFDLAYKLAFVLAEGCTAKGYTDYAPWDTNRPKSIDDSSFYNWDYSSCSEPEGHAIMKGNSIFISSNKQRPQITNSDINAVYNILKPFTDKNALRVFFAIYDLTIHDCNVYVSKEEISGVSHLSKEAVADALDKLPYIMETAEDKYRIDGQYLHLAPLLLMLWYK